MVERQDVLHRASLLLGWCVLICALVLPGLFGSFAIIGAEIVTIFLGGVILAQGKWRWPGHAAMAMFVAVFLVLAGAYAVSARNPGNLVYLVSMLPLVLAWAVFRFARDEMVEANTARTIAILCLLGALAALTLAVGQVAVEPIARATGLGMGSNMLGRVGIVLGFSALAGVLVERSRWRYLFYLGPIAAIAVGLISGSRGALLAVPVMGVVFAAFALADRRNRWPLLWLLAAGVAVVALDVILGEGATRFASLGNVAGELLATGGTVDQATQERVIMYQAGWQAFLASPFVGYGWANLAAAAAPFMDMTRFGGPTDPYFQYHNDFLNFAVAAGVPGIACWLMLLAAPVVGALASPRDSLFRLRLCALLMLSSGYFVFGLTDITLGYDLPTTIYAFLTAIVLGGWVDRKERAPA